MNYNGDYRYGIAARRAGLSSKALGFLVRGWSSSAQKRFRGAVGFLWGVGVCLGFRGLGIQRFGFEVYGLWWYEHQNF